MRIQTAPTHESPSKRARESPDETLPKRLSRAGAAAAKSIASPQTVDSSTAASSGSASRATFLRSFVHAWAGIVYTFRTQRNARVHLAAAIGATALGLVLRISPVEFGLIALAIMAVMAAEMLNTVAEAIVDMVTSEYHPLARVAKDVAAGAVLLCAIFSVVIALLVFGPHLWPLAARLVHEL